MVAIIEKFYHFVNDVQFLHVNPIEGPQKMKRLPFSSQIISSHLSVSE
jgi:hypothetical protein